MKFIPIGALIALPLLQACLPNKELPTKYSQDPSVVLAVNVGGESYEGSDGIFYQADSLNIKTPKGYSKGIKGSQDSKLYESYRQGEVALEIPMANGIYDVTLKFAEPFETKVGERVFNVLAQDEVVISKLDVRLARDGKILSSLDRTVTDIQVDDGALKLGFQPIKGEPLLHALIVRKKQVMDSRWQLVWQDEFNYDGRPDPTKWNFDIWPARKVNNEDQAYTDRLKNARVEGGRLIIEAHREKYGNAEYTSARLNSANKGDFLYGRADVRAKLAKGQGTWSAIWMLPTDPFKYATRCESGTDWQGNAHCDAWPNSGEIDIMEHVGYDMGRIHGTVHTKAYYWVKWEQRKASIEGKNVAEQFHTYSIEWSPERITILLDNVPYFTYVNEGDGWESWPFDHPFHLVLNLAIGGDWGRAGGPIDNSLFPARMEVDYVRIYKANDAVLNDKSDEK